MIEDFSDGVLETEPLWGVTKVRVYRPAKRIARESRPETLTLEGITGARVYIERGEHITRCQVTVNGINRDLTYLLPPGHKMMVGHSNYYDIESRRVEISSDWESDATLLIACLHEIGHAHDFSNKNPNATEESEQAGTRIRDPLGEYNKK